MDLLWFKRDLRIQDHAPLVAAAEQSSLLCLYVFEPSTWESVEYAPCHHEFINECLQELQEALERRGSGLHIAYGEVPVVLADIRRRYPFTRLLSHEETGLLRTYERDLRVRKFCQQSGVSWLEFPQTGVVRRLRGRDGWSGQWLSRMKKPVAPTPDRLPPPPFSLAFQLRSVEELGLAGRSMPERQLGGSRLAHETLTSFLDHRGKSYRQGMSSPVTAITSCSRLSPYLAYGAITMKQVHQRLETVRKDAKGNPDRRGWAGSLSSYAGRLRWHCHFMQKLEDEPELEWKNLHPGYDGLREAFDERLFEAFCRGETGYPMVDACLHYLAKTGWINFRMRAMLMSFCSYHLWLHWRRPAEFLARQFLDFEPGIHYSQCQMQSGTTGINAIRIYSPAKQVLDQDPEGAFIRAQLPALARVPKAYLAEPHTMPLAVQKEARCEIGSAYPAPIVDHATAYKEARRQMFAWRQRPEVKEHNDAVYQKHGSRRRPPKRERSQDDD